MITYHKEYGCWFQMNETAKHYALYKAKTYKHNSTSDRVIIWDEDNDEMVNFVYGASVLSVDELDKAVSEYVTQYESIQKKEAKNKVKAFAKYEFTKAGVNNFLDKASTDFFEDMDNGGEHLDQFNIVVTCGKHKISMPLGAYLWDQLTDCLTDAVEDWEA